MKYRKDITEFIILIDKKFKKIAYRAYEHKNKIYRANRDGYMIMYYSGYCLCGVDEIKDMIESKFDVSLATDNDDIICRCGNDSFSASYGTYSLDLKCKTCGHKFEAYSG